jgi:hypothetical protein
VYVSFLQHCVCYGAASRIDSKALLMFPSPANAAPEDRPRRPRAAFVVGDEWTVADPESPRAIRLNRDADSRSNHDHLWFLGWGLKPNRSVAEQVAALVLSV